MSIMSIREEDLINNPTARVPVCLVLDTSGSMDGEPINELNEGVRLFFEAVLEDEIAQYSAEIAVVTFGGSADVQADFQDIHSQKIPELSAQGRTPMGAAVMLALDLLNSRKAEYSRAGVEYFQPWMVLMTDGQPTDSIEAAVSGTLNLVEKKKLSVFAIGIGEEADMETLKRFSPKHAPLKLKGLRFKEFFEWLSKSVSVVSQSTPGDSPKLNTSGIDSWGEI